jgi:hypothetical protein
LHYKFTILHRYKIQIILKDLDKNKAPTRIYQSRGNKKVPINGTFLISFEKETDYFLVVSAGAIVESTAAVSAGAIAESTTAAAESAIPSAFFSPEQAANDIIATANANVNTFFISFLCGV